MQINKITVENFRSIAEKIFIDGNGSKLKIFVGANNTGKSNILRAVNLFFNGASEPNVPFNASQDLSNRSSKPINVYMEMQFSNIDDKYITRFIDKKFSGEFREYLIRAACICYGTGNIQYSFTNIKGQKRICQNCGTVLKNISTVFIYRPSKIIRRS